MKFIGHRGASHVVPENTVAAVRTALSVGYGFEIDLQLLRDGTLIVLHDDTLERTAAPDAHTSGLMRSPITSLRLPDVAGVDVGSWFGADFADERPPLFADVLRELRRSYSVPGSVHAHCFAELKGDRPHDPALPGIAAAAVAEMRVPPATLTWISFSLPVLLEMKAICPQYRALYIADARTADAAWRAARASVGARLDGVDLRAHPDVVTAELCEWMHARGKLVAVRVSKAPAKEDTVEMYEAMERHGVDFFTSNLPPVLHTWRRRRQRTSDVRMVAKTAAGMGAGFATALAASGDVRLSEDLVDLAHSCVALNYSVRATAAGLSAPSPQRWADDNGRRGVAPPALVPVLPPHVDERARSFVLCSTAYFACDCLYVLGSLARGRRPHQWAERLAHHTIQFAANLPALTTSPSSAVVRRYLLAAYLAEASTVLLRLRAISRKTSLCGPKLHRLLLRALLGSFVLTRLVNFPLNTYAIFQAKHALPPLVYKLHLAFAACGIVLSAGWFSQLCKLASTDLTHATHGA